MESVEGLLILLEPLLVDQDDQPDDLETNEDFAEEQSLVARFVNLIRAATNDQQFLVSIFWFLDYQFEREIIHKLHFSGTQHAIR